MGEAWESIKTISVLHVVATILCRIFSLKNVSWGKWLWER
jgi:hypothetical protein